MYNCVCDPVSSFLKVVLIISLILSYFSVLRYLLHLSRNSHCFNIDSFSWSESCGKSSCVIHYIPLSASYAGYEKMKKNTNFITVHQLLYQNKIVILKRPCLLGTVRGRRHFRFPVHCTFTSGMDRKLYTPFSGSMCPRD